MRKPVVVSLVAWVSIEREFASFINLYLCLCARLWTVCASRRRAAGIKQSKGFAKNQTIKIPRIPLSHPTRFQNQNNQNPGKIPGKIENTASPESASGGRRQGHGQGLGSRLRHLSVPELCVPQVRFLRAHACERLLGFLGGPKPPLQVVVCCFDSGCNTSVLNMPSTGCSTTP